MKNLYFYLWLLSLLFLVSCVSPQYENTTKGAAYGAATGVFIGQYIGKNTNSTMTGAVIGGAAGTAAGYFFDKQLSDLKANIQREGNILMIILNGDVTFETNSYRINPVLHCEIDRIAEILKKYQHNITIEGYTDSYGTKSYNMRLSKKRAESVKKVLVEKGVNPSRIKVIAFGELKPRESNNTNTGRQLNRRVEIKISKNDLKGEVLKYIPSVGNKDILSIQAMRKDHINSEKNLRKIFYESEMDDIEF